MGEAYRPSVVGVDWMVSFDKDLKMNQFSDYPDLIKIGDRWTSTNLQNNFLRFNSTLTKEAIQEKLAVILKVPKEKISVYPVPFLGTAPIY